MARRTNYIDTKPTGWRDEAIKIMSVIFLFDTIRYIVADISTFATDARVSKMTNYETNVSI